MKIFQCIKSLIIPTLMTFMGCATFRSDLNGEYLGQSQRNFENQPVKALFTFTHIHQTLGYDALPKIVGKTSMIRSFDDVFNDALKEFSNLKLHATFTDEASDVNRSERRATFDSLKALHDYTIKIRIIEEKRFASSFFAGLTSTVSATLIPAPYRQSYRMETEVFTSNGKLVASYHRQAFLTKWVELLLLFAYPFYPEDRKREEVFLAMFHDTFRQMESEKILKGS
jgi:hypothetical protein